MPDANRDYPEYGEEGPVRIEKNPGGPERRWRIVSNIGRGGLPPGPRRPPIEPLRHKDWQL